MIAERAIRIKWVFDTVQAPELRTDENHDSEVERFFKSIHEREGRVLRVVVNTSKEPWLVVTAFFDRALKGPL